MNGRTLRTIFDAPSEAPKPQKTAAPLVVTATDLQRRSSAVLDAAKAAPVLVTRDGEVWVLTFQQEAFSGVK